MIYWVTELLDETNSPSHSLTQSLNSSNGSITHSPNRSIFRQLSTGQGQSTLSAPGKIQIVSGHQSREPVLAVQPFQHFHHTLRAVRVQITRRLIGQQDGRLVGQRSRQCHPLLLAARKLAHAALRALSSPTSAKSSTARTRAAAKYFPAINCGSMIFSAAVNSGRR